MRIPSIAAWQERREREQWARLRREARWDELAKYNSRISQGIVHTPEYVEKMRREQAAFDAAHGYIGQIDDGLTFDSPTFDYGTRRP